MSQKSHAPAERGKTAKKRLRRMRADAAWRQAQAIPRAHKQERASAFARLREHYGFSEYGLHEAAKRLRVSWIAEHLDAVLAQTLASRAYHALNRVCLGQARRVRENPSGTRSLQHREQAQRYRTALCAATAGGGQSGFSGVERRLAGSPDRLAGPGRQTWPRSPHQIRAPGAAQSQQSRSTGSRCQRLSLLRAIGALWRRLSQTQTHGGKRHHRGRSWAFHHCPGPASG
jgi:hypothetical protein